MELLDFLDSHEDTWERILTGPPYNLHVIKEKSYVLFYYDEKLSDAAQILTNEANGAVFRKDEKKWICVNYGLPRIFDIQDSHAPANFMIETAETYQYIDGQIVYVWNDLGTWHISSREQIDINKQLVNMLIPLQDLLHPFLTKNFTSQLSPEFCYTFILTNPKAQKIADYGEQTKLWYITRRNLLTFKEDPTIPNFNIDVQLPHHFVFLRKRDLLEALRKVVTKDEVGYSMIDGRGNRVAVFGNAYLTAKSVYDKTSFAPIEIIKLWKTDQLYPYLQLFGKNPIVKLIVDSIHELVDKADANFFELKEQANNDYKTFFASVSQSYPSLCDYYERKWSKPDLTADLYFKKVPDRLLAIDIQKMMKKKQKEYESIS